MRTIANSLAAALILAIGAAHAHLETAPAQDCSRARDPQRCVARLEARAACQDKGALEKRRCQSQLMPPPDCSRAGQPARCEAQAAARAACKDKVGSEHRRCMRARLPGWRSWEPQPFR